VTNSVKIIEIGRFHLLQFAYLHSDCKLQMKPTAKLSFKITAAVLIFLVKVILRLEIRGRENLPASGPIIAICNHLHLFDPLIHIICILPRDSIFLAKEELFRFWPIPFFALLMKITDALPVPRHGTPEERREVLEKSLKVLEEGNVLGIYPEGTRSSTGKLIMANPGATRLALRSGASLIAVGIYGTEYLKGIGWFSRPRVVVTFGEPFTLPAQEHEPSVTKIQQLTVLIMEQLCAVLPSKYHGYYGKLDTNPL
jgi:1-acyl-sn-glycerol-3-phosphate acyltransferase